MVCRHSVTAMQRSDCFCIKEHGLGGEPDMRHAMFALSHHVHNWQFMRVQGMYCLAASLAVLDAGLHLYA